MEMNEKNNFGLEKNGINVHNHHLDFQGSGFLPEAQMTSSSPSALVAMSSSFPPSIWNPSAQNLSLGGTSANAALIAGHQFTSLPGILRGGLSPFPADSGFIERATRFSCFSGSNLGSIINHPFTNSEHLGNFHNDNEASRENETSVGKGCRDASLVCDRMQGDVESSHGVGAPNHETGEPESSGGGEQEEEGPNVGCANKRKRSGQDGGMNHVERSQKLAANSVTQKNESDERGEPKRLVMASGKLKGKQCKENADAPKEEYIHVRARRGQATNSHSLAERVRREKISERMKFLQDLVPGCNKVTGKAVMLDEIINYVQSLQRQVEFLSMKLATVNPRLDFNIESVLSKDLFQSQGAASSAFGFLPDIGHPQLHPSQLIQPGVPGILNPADALGRLANAGVHTSNAYKEPTHQVPNTWDGEFHDVMQMPFTPINTQELNDKTSDGF